jgi:hypothetical protein
MIIKLTLSIIILLIPSQHDKILQKNRINGGNNKHNGAVADTTHFEDPLRDGPHVFWQTDSSAIVFYLCNGKMEKRTFHVKDTLRFYGFCLDDAIEYIVPADAAVIKPQAIDHASKILAISDIHGEYDHLVDILTRSGVISPERRWSWGDGHLVIVGDVFDRGARVTECLWLIYRLESEARENGGAVHFILGNHELMALRGDLRYVHDRYLKGIVKKTRIKYEDLYGPDTVLGRWLRSKHATIKINDIVFVHGGLSPFVIDRNLGMEQINEIVRGSIDLRSSRLAFDELSRFLFGNKGPFWYRGYHHEMKGNYPLVLSEDIDSILSFYGASTIVVGHSEVDSVTSLWSRRIIGIDVPVDELGSLEALLWDDGRFFRVTGKGDRRPIE